ncbi:tripartite tricarboxylate transporter TctB family protein [Glutamicibacter uratoxydans]|uniref:tripartite tricarboxylate transporter TctB family protein n=1 Tax=Glutamicibacter uratoxydans TaxID=43667 RepID=UPI003D6FD72F
MSHNNAMGRRFATYKISTMAIALLGAGCTFYGFSLGLGTMAQPRAGAWPFLVGLGLCLAAVALFFTERVGTDYEPFSKRSWIIVAGFGLMIAYILLFESVGFSLATLLVSIAWLRWMAKEPWRFTLWYSLAQTALFVTIFSILLAVPMPYDPVVNLLSGKGL